MNPLHVGASLPPLHGATGGRNYTEWSMDHGAALCDLEAFT
jgi:hypothetical protein